MIRRAKEKLVLQYDSTVNFFADALMRMRTHEGFKRYFKNTGWLFGGRMAGMVAGFFVGAYVARYLGPAQYGLLNYAVSFAGLFAVFASLGIENILSRELVAHPENRDELLGTGFLIKLIGSIFAIVVVTTTLVFINSDRLTNSLILLSVSAFAFQAFGVIDIYFQSQVLAKNTVRIQLVSMILSAFLKLVLIYFGAGLIWFAGVYLFDAIVFAMGLAIAYRKAAFAIFRWRFSRKAALMLLKNSWPLMISGAAVMIYMKIDQIMIKNMLGNEAAGLYSVAVKLSDVWYFIPSMICASVFPAIVNAKKVSKSIYFKRIKRLYGLMALLSIGIALPVFVFADEIIRILFGPAYLGASPALRVYVWAGIPVFLGITSGQYLLVENYNIIALYTTLGGALANITLNILLIPRYGIVGAATATIVSYSLAAGSIVLFKRVRIDLVSIIRID